MFSSPQIAKAFIGVRVVDGERFMLAKLSMCKNFPGGCILRRAFFFGSDNPKERQLCPNHVSWPLTRCRAAPGALLFSSVNRRDSDRALKAAFARMGVPEARRYSPHGFRLGANQELKECGSPLLVVATSWVWRASDFRGYADLARDVETGVRQMFEVDRDAYLDDEE